MKNMSVVFAAALSLAALGCKKQGGDCDKAIANSMEVSKATMAKMPGVDDKMLAKMQDLGVKHCQDDKWSEAAIKCMADAKSETEAQGCYGKLTPDQQAKMNKAAMELTPPAAAGAGSAAAGRAADSAAAGSVGSGVGSAASSATGSDTGAAGSAGSGSAPAGGSDTAGGSAGSAAAPK